VIGLNRGNDLVGVWNGDQRERFSEKKPYALRVSDVKIYGWKRGQEQMAPAIVPIHWPNGRG
jgi:hypothetical protein